LIANGTTDPHTLLPYRKDIQHGNGQNYNYWHRQKQALSKPAKSEAEVIVR